MSQQTKTSISSVEDLDVIVDADSHVTEDLEADLLPYVDDEFSGVKYMIERADKPRSEIYSYTRVSPPFMQMNYEETYGVHEADTKLDDMAELGIDYSVISPGITVGLPTVQNDQAAVAIGDAYNAWLLDEILDRDESLKGTMVVSHQKPEKFAEQIDEYGPEEDIVGVQFPPSGPLPPIGDERYDPIYQAAQDHGLPIAMHAGNVDGINHFPVLRTWNETFAEDHALTFPFAHMWQLTTMVFRGLPVRFPDLDYVIQESGIAWLPYMMWRLDDHYYEMSQELPLLEKPPSEYIKDHFNIATQPLGLAEKPMHMAWIMKIIGPDNVMFASDHPHPDFDTPEQIFSMIRSEFDDDEIANIMGGNAKRVFGL